MVDNLTPEQRSFTMSRIRSRDTKPELTIRRLVHARGLRFRTHKNGLPGRPDLVFVRAKVAVFVDGDFWHGWQFPRWRHKLGPYWRKKIEGNRCRDRRTSNKLRGEGWLVVVYYIESRRFLIRDSPRPATTYEQKTGGADGVKGA